VGTGVSLAGGHRGIVRYSAAIRGQGAHIVDEHGVTFEHAQHVDVLGHVRSRVVYAAPPTCPTTAVRPS
jgi:hypothetical protein